MNQIVWDKREMARLEKALGDSMRDVAKSLDKAIKDAQVVPKASGALEDSQQVTATDDSVSVSYDTPYAKRLYYHPEYNFRHDKNANAKGMWLEEFKDGTRVVEEYARRLKEKV